MYHYVHDRDPLARPDGQVIPNRLRALSIQDFRAQLDLLSTTMEPIDWPTFFAWTAGRSRVPQRCFLLTFDDGLADHTADVVPILEERGLRGTFFVPTSVLTAHRMLPAHQIHLLLSSLGEGPFREHLRAALRKHHAGHWCRWLEQEGGHVHAEAAAMYHYETPGLGELKFLLTMKLPLDLRAKLLDELFEERVGSSARWARHWYLSWDDAARLESLGHTIGGHGHVHEPYSRLSPQEAAGDVRRSSAVLREGLGPDARPFSYPYGDATEAARAALGPAGFVHGFTTTRRRTGRGDDPFRLPRCDTIDVHLMIEEPCLCPPH
jgi:peptidoglycan/xylan/chitin deacetylase (PgdA/CDA1 family)